MIHQAELLEKLRSRQALIGIVGLGYVGLPLSLTYAEVGYQVLGFDIDQAKADAINQGQSYIEHIDGERVSKPGKSKGLRPPLIFPGLQKPML